MTKRKKIWIACGAAVALGLIIFFSIRAVRRDEAVVQTSKVQRTEVLKSQVSASGEIRAKEFVNLQSEVAGVVTELAVREGDSVKKGDVLLRIDPIQTAAEADSTSAQFDAAAADARTQQFQIMNAEAGLARDQSVLGSARAELEQAQNNYTRSQNTFKRIQLLNEQGLISREDYERQQNESRMAKSQLDVAKARVSQTETQIDISKNSIQQMKNAYAAARSRSDAVAANLTRAKDMLKRTTLYSPLDGVISQLLVEKGERAVPGIMSNPQATLMTIADLSIIQAELKVDETDVVSLALKQKAQIKVDALPDSTFDGEVTEIGNSPIRQGVAQQEAKDFKVKVTLINPSNKLRPGMSCTGEIVTGTKRDVLVVPIQALTIRDVEVDKDGNYHEPAPGKRKEDSVAHADTSRAKPQKKELEGVFIVTKDRLARFRPVKTGITGESEIEILANLKEGEEVISGSFQTLRTLKDGAAVKIDNKAKTEVERKS